MIKQATKTKLPRSIGRLDELAHNMWWSWHLKARQLFRALDYPLRIISGRNPVKQLRGINPDKLQAAASDPSFFAANFAATSKCTFLNSGNGDCNRRKTVKIPLEGGAYRA